jgi:hypothetical protein
MATPMLPENRVKYNLITSTSDTVCAKISKMKARIQFLTSGGDYDAKRQAQQLTKFMDGLFYHNGIYKLHQMAFRDSTVFDAGALKHYRKDNQIVTERVLGLELYVDAADALYGKPQSLYQIKYFNRATLIEMYPRFKSDIAASAESFDRTLYKAQELAEFVAVIEAWHLPTPGVEGAKGRHVITIEKATLLDEEYNREHFPFTFFQWSAPVTGFWGQSLTERLTGNQIEINKMLRTIQKSFHLGSAFKVFLEYGSRVAKEHLNNEIGSIVYYSGSKPEFYVPQTVHPEYFRHLDWLITKGYEEAGVSVSSATSQKPAGLESGVAIREYNDIETERFAIISQSYEHSFLQTARQYIELAKEIYENGEELEVTAQSKKFIEKIKWSDVALDKEDYIMQMFPVSMLPHEPAGRLAFVQDLMNMGAINQDTAVSLLDFPDIEVPMDRKTAAMDDINKVIEAILDKGIEGFSNPEPFQDLQNGIEMMHGAYLEAKNNNVDEEKLDLLRQWMAMAKALQQPPQQSAQPGSPPAPGAAQPAAPAQQQAPAPQGAMPAGGPPSQ